jgi:hypothetical protein
VSVCCFEGSCSECAPPHIYSSFNGHVGSWDDWNIRLLAQREGRAPWSWASLPGRYGCECGGWHYGQLALRVSSIRLPEPLSPESRALVSAARGGG